MNRRTSILCLILVAAAAVLLATPASAVELPFDVYNHGALVNVGFPSGYPYFETYTTEQACPPNSLGITRMAVYVKGDFTTGDVWDGRDVWLTDDGDALFARFTGRMWLVPDPVDPVNNPPTVATELHQTFVGGTGLFAGARGTSTHHCHIVYDDWPALTNCSNDCHSQGTLILPNLKNKPVPMKAWEGDLVSLVQQHVEREAWGLPPLPYLAQKTVHTGNGTQLGEFSNAKLTLLNTDTGTFSGFFTNTADNGDTLDGYYEGALFPLGDPLGVFGMEDARIWMTGGTGRFANASGTMLASGILTLDGMEDIDFAGSISSVGSSKK